MAHTKIQLKNSVVRDKVPSADDLLIGEVCVGAHPKSPMLLFKDSNDNIIKVKPGSGVITGDKAPSSPSAGDLWFDTDASLLYYYNGSDWVELGTAGDSPVTSVNGQVGTVVLTASDVGALAAGDNVSELTNDAGYVTSADVSVSPWTISGSSTVRIIPKDLTQNVGIGFDSAKTTLEVRKESESAIVRVSNSGNGNRSGIEFYRENIGGPYKGGGGIWVESDTSNNLSDLNFGAFGSGSIATSSPSMVLNNAGNVYIGGTFSSDTIGLWLSTLTEEQLEEYEAGVLTPPADVSNPGNGEYARQWWYSQQSAVNKALIDDNELQYPYNFQATNFADSFALEDTTNVYFLNNGNVYFKNKLGIGRSDFDNQLAVNGSTVLNGVLTLENLLDDTSVRSRSINFSFEDGIGAKLVCRKEAGKTSEEAYMSFRFGGATADEERVRFFPNGNVAIGSGDTTSRLLVSGEGGTDPTDNEIELTNGEGEARQLSFTGTDSVTWNVRSTGLTGENTFELAHEGGDIPGQITTVIDPYGNLYHGGTLVRNTLELWKSTLSKEQLLQYEEGTFTAPANVSNPGTGEYVRGYWYAQQTAEDQALIDAGELAYPEYIQPANFTDLFAIGDGSSINLYANGNGFFNGKLGIHVAEPLCKLHVKRNAGSGITSVSSGTDVIFESETNSAILISTPSTKFGQILFGDEESNTTGRVQYSHETNTMSFKTNELNRMFIDGDGNVGINRSAPTETLDVNGTILANTIRASKNFDLESLTPLS